MNKKVSRKKRARRVRAKIKGTEVCPRLCVSKSLKYIYAQIIEDEKGKVFASIDSRKIKNSKNDIETARKIGKEIAVLAKSKKINEVIFDRQGYKYHGKIKALAEGAREGGLKF